MAVVDTQQISVRIQAAPKLNMPAGRADFTVLVRVARAGPKRFEVKAGVQAAYVKLARRGEVADSVVLDDGAIVIDLDDRDRVLGVELLSLKTPNQLPEYKRYVAERVAADPRDICVVLAPQTAVRLWRELDNSIGVAVEAVKRLARVTGVEPSEEQIHKAIQVPKADALKQFVRSRARGDVAGGKLPWASDSGSWSSSRLMARA